MGIVTVMARITARPGNEARLRELTRPLIAATRSEAGCLRYDLLCADGDPCSLLMLEEWASHEALATHLESKHIGAFREAAGSLLAGTDVVTFADVDVVRD